MAENATSSWLVVGLDTSVLVLGLIMKVPQITTVVRRGTSDGISLTSLVMEFWV